MKIKKKKRKEISGRLLFALLFFWVLLQFFLMLSPFMPTGATIANITSATGTVTFTVTRPAAPAPAPVEELAPEVGAAVFIPHAPAAQPTEAAVVAPVSLPPAEAAAPPEAPLFDVALELPQLQITPEEGLTFKTTLINFGEPGVVPVTITYTITDQQNNVVAVVEKTITVETQTELLETVPLPPDLPVGTYSLSVALSYNGQVAQSSTTFTVTEKGTKGTTISSVLASVREFGAAAVNAVNSFFESVAESIAHWFFGIIYSNLLLTS